MAVRFAVLAFIALAQTAYAEPIRIFAAGSLAGVVGDLVAASGLPADAVARPVFGPAGLLRQRIEGGEQADLFLSADLSQPQHLADGGRFGPVVPFARNRLCVVGRAALGLTQSGMLDRLLDPAMRIATSTPGADPGGDYAWTAFARAETLHRGARATLEAKAQTLFGGPTTMVPADGHTPGGAVLLTGQAETLLYYCSSAPAVLQEVPDSVSIPLPPELEPGPVYGLTAANAAPDAQHLALFILSAPGQAILARSNLLPVLPEAGAVLTVIGPSGRPASLSAADLRAIPATALTVKSETGAATHLSGPTLLSVLQQSGAIDPDFHAHVRQVVTATGRDGYSATVALGEIDPEFEDKAALVATSRDGAPLDPPRLVLPGDKRLGRSVRDLVSLVVR